MVEDRFVLLILVTQEFSSQTLFIYKYSSIINNGKSMLYFFNLLLSLYGINVSNSCLKISFSLFKLSIMDFNIFFYD